MAKRTRSPRSPTLEAKPNGCVNAYYGTVASCIHYILDWTDWIDAQKRPDANLWALSAQSGTVTPGAGDDRIERISKRQDHRILGHGHILQKAGYGRARLARGAEDGHGPKR